MEKDELLKRVESLADATRLEIIELLSQNGEMCACELLKRLSIAQGTLSHHMKDLTSSGIVSYRKEGKWCHYVLNAEAICDVTDYLNALCCPGQSPKSCSCQSK